MTCYSLSREGTLLFREMTLPLPVSHSLTDVSSNGACVWCEKNNKHWRKTNEKKRTQGTRIQEKDGEPGCAVVIRLLGHNRKEQRKACCLSRADSNAHMHIHSSVQPV